MCYLLYRLNAASPWRLEYSDVAEQTVKIYDDKRAAINEGLRKYGEGNFKAVRELVYHQEPFELRE